MSLKSCLFHLNRPSLSPGTGVYYVGVTQKAISKLIFFLCAQIFFDAVKTAVSGVSILYAVGRNETLIPDLKIKMFNICQQTTCFQGKKLLLGNDVFSLNIIFQVKFQ